MEFKNWQTHNVYEEVPDNGQSVRWVITKKIKNGESVTKARLVAHGFEECSLDEIKKDSPTCSKENPVSHFSRDLLIALENKFLRCQSSVFAG